MVARAGDIGLNQRGGIGVGIGMRLGDLADRGENMAEAVVIGAGAIGGERVYSLSAALGIVDIARSSAASGSLLASACSARKI